MNTSVLKAMVKLYQKKGDSNILDDIEQGYLTDNTARSGREVLWYVDEGNNIAMYIDTLEFMSDEEIEKELL